MHETVKNYIDKWFTDAYMVPLALFSRINMNTLSFENFVC
jgi:hypothetical protein